MSKASGRSKALSRRRHIARLASVQALYQMEMADQRAESVVLEFLKHRRNEEIDGLSLGELDEGLFSELVVGISREAEKLDGLLSESLAADWSVERLERILRIILRLGAYELAFRPEAPAGVVINECVDLAHAYYAGKEPGMVNGVLDRLARTLRGDAVSGGRQDEAVQQS